MSNPIPCPDSGKSPSKAYELFQEVKTLRSVWPSAWDHKVRQIERLAAESLNEWSDVQTAFNLQKDLFEMEAKLHQELLNGAKKVAAALGEIESWNPDVIRAVVEARSLIEDHIILSDPDYIRWTIAAPITDA